MFPIYEEEISTKAEAEPADKLVGVDKFYRPERVKLSDFVKKSKVEGSEEKPAKLETAPLEEVATEPAASESADLPSDNLPATIDAKIGVSGEHGKQSKDEIRDSVKGRISREESGSYCRFEKTGRSG